MRLRRTLALAAMTMVAVACWSPTASPRQSPTMAEKNMAALEAKRQRYGQQPHGNPSYPKSVGEQPTEDPMHAGRPLSE